MQRDLTVREACKKADIIYQDFIVLIRNNVIPNYRIGNNYMIRESDLNNWIEQQKNRQKLSVN